MRSQIDAFLEGEIRELAMTANEHPNDDSGLQLSLQKELGVRSRNDLGFRLIDDNGLVFVSSAVEDDLREAWKQPYGWGSNESLIFCETLQPEGKAPRFRVCSQRVELADGRKCTAQCSYLLKQLEESLSRLRGICLAVLGIAPLLALALGSFLASRSLEPVRHIMDTANAISASDLRARIALSGTGDEMDRLAETLNDMLRRIEQKVREVQRFTADASHELRTPLAALRGCAEVALSRHRSTEELRKSIEECIPQYERLQRLAEDLLFLARLDAGEPVIKFEPISLASAVRDMIDLYAPLAEEKGLELLTRDLKPVMVLGDGGRIRQVIGNIIDNAVKYTAANGRIVASLSSNNGNASVEITDNGVGISANDLPNVFNRFYRADPARSGQLPPGVGLGLSISRSIIEAHGGTIAITSAQHKGTCVQITIPSLSNPALD